MDADRQCLVFHTQFINLITIQHIISGLRLSLASWVWSLVDTVLLYYYRLSLVPGCGPSSIQSSCTIIVYRWFLGVVPRRYSPLVLLSFIVGWGGFPECGPSSTQSSCTIITDRWLGGFPECGPSSTQSSCIIIIYRWLGGFPECAPSSTQSSCIIIIYRWLGGFPECAPSSTQSSCTIIVYRWLGGFLSVVPHRHSPPVIMKLLSPVALAQLGVPCLCKERRY